ncbi:MULTISPECIES: hypothetical protein [Oxalobacteraceae]|jgi:hypothetical protein|uniref:hypothetical protein n=1 Tax=Oxalobacteraceae TaxID=75682 RepID=UPI0010A2AD15|nr:MULTISPECIES: hypothetical protein [Oxalobacteraceae]
MANDIGITMGSQFVQVDGVELQSTLNVEQWMLLVQQERVGELDNVVTQQAEQIHKRNQAIANLNTALSAVTAIQAKFASDAKPGDKVRDAVGGEGPWSAGDYQLETDVNEALTAAGVDNLFNTPMGQRDTNEGGSANHINWQGHGMCGDRTKGDVDGAISKLKSTIDALSNLQQMDTLRLQSVMNKRNEGFDIMSNFIKKYSDVLDSIIRNLA